MARSGTQSSVPTAARSGGCFVYDGRLRLLCRFSPCDCEVIRVAYATEPDRHYHQAVYSCSWGTVWKFRRYMN